MVPYQIKSPLKSTKSKAAGRKEGWLASQVQETFREEIYNHAHQHHLARVGSSLTKTSFLPCAFRAAVELPIARKLDGRKA